MTRYSHSILSGKGIFRKIPSSLYAGMLLFSMDDLVVTGVLGIIGIYLSIFLFLFVIYSVGRLMYTLLAAGNFGLVLHGIVAILISIMLYTGTGCWLRKTDRI